MRQTTVTTSAAHLAASDRNYLKNHKIKSPKPKYVHTPDGGRTLYYASNLDELATLKKKYPKNS